MIVNKLTENSLNIVVIRAAITNLEVNEFTNELKMLTNAGWIYYYE